MSAEKQATVTVGHAQKVLVDRASTYRCLKNLIELLCCKLSPFFCMTPDKVKHQWPSMLQSALRVHEEDSDDTSESDGDDTNESNSDDSDETQARVKAAADTKAADPTVTPAADAAQERRGEGGVHGQGG